MMNSEEESTIHQTKSQIFFRFLQFGLLAWGGPVAQIAMLRQSLVGWMSDAQFLDGIALSGILPAPLIIFSTFVGYFGGGWIGAILMTVGVLLPAFLFTILGHSFLEKIIAKPSLHRFLDGVTAGVIGLIATTAIQLFITTINSIFSLILFGIAIFFLDKFKSKLIPAFVIVGLGLVSLVYHLLIDKI
jgi:chromate transporter